MPSRAQDYYNLRLDRGVGTIFRIAWSFSSIRQPIDQQTLNRWFTPQYQLGTSPRFPLHGPGINNLDLALRRTFNIHEA